MRAVVQRVSRASVTVGGEVVGRIGAGFLVLLGVEEGDGQEQVNFMAQKIAGLRIFEDADSKMNLGLAEVGGAMLVVSQFTLLGDCRKGRRPSFVQPLGRRSPTSCTGRSWPKSAAKASKSRPAASSNTCRSS